MEQPQEDDAAFVDRMITEWYDRQPGDRERLCGIAARAVSPWRPIESAPKDGTWVLLGGEEPDDWWPATWTNKGWSHSLQDHIPPEFKLARWAPLPDHPNPPAAHLSDWPEIRAQAAEETPAERPASAGGLLAKILGNVIGQIYDVARSEVEASVFFPAQDEVSDAEVEAAVRAHNAVRRDANGESPMRDALEAFLAARASKGARP